MDFGFLATANSITGKYFEQTAAGRSSVTAINEDAKKQFEKEIENAQKSMEATKALDENMLQNHKASHNDPIKEHAARLGFSIDNRVIDMLNVQLSDDMHSRIRFAMNNAMEDLADAM
jgi:hypothetical protein